MYYYVIKSNKNLEDILEQSETIINYYETDEHTWNNGMEIKE